MCIMLFSSLKSRHICVQLIFRNVSYFRKELDSFLATKDTKKFNGYEIIPLTEKNFENGWNVMTDVFFKEEKTCRFLELYKIKEAQQDLKNLFSWVVQDGASIAARNIHTDKIVGMTLNKIWVPEDRKFLREYQENCTHPVSKKYMTEIIDVDLFKLCNVGCIFETIVSVSDSEARGSKINKAMFTWTHEYAQKVVRDAQNQSGSKQAIPNIILCVATHPAAKYAVQLQFQNTKSKQIEYHQEIAHNGQKTIVDALVLYSYLP